MIRDGLGWFIFKLDASYRKAHLNRYTNQRIVVINSAHGPVGAFQGLKTENLKKNNVIKRATFLNIKDHDISIRVMALYSGLPYLNPFHGFL